MYHFLYLNLHELGKTTKIEHYSGEKITTPARIYPKTKRMARHIDDLIELTEHIFSQISSHPAFSWKLRARSKLSPSDHTISVSCCFWYAVSVWILDSSRSDPGNEHGGIIFIYL